MNGLTFASASAVEVYDQSAFVLSEGPIIFSFRPYKCKFTAAEPLNLMSVLTCRHLQTGWKNGGS